jgi:hypothetical protein
MMTSVVVMKTNNIITNNVVTELKDLDGKSYEEIGVLGSDSNLVIWSNQYRTFPLKLGLIPGFIVSKGNSYTQVECQAIFEQSISMMTYGFSIEKNDYSTDFLARFDFDNYVKHYGGYDCKVVFRSLDRDTLTEDEMLVTISPYGDINPYSSGVFFVLVQISNEMLSEFISSIQSSPNNIEANLDIKIDTCFVADNADGVMLNLIDGAEIDNECYFSYRTGGDSGQRMTQILKQRNGIMARLIRLNWRAILIQIGFIIVTITAGLLLAYLFKPQMHQLSEWLS